MTAPDFFAPPPPHDEALRLAIRNLDRDATDVLIGYLAGHFATHGALDTETMRRFVAEAEAVTS